MGVVRPHRALHAISISFDNSTPRNAVLASRSTDGGATWGDAARCCASTTRARSATTSTTRRRSPPTRPTRVRLRDLGPPRSRPARQLECTGVRDAQSASTGRRGSRAAPTAARVWEPARPIFDPKALNQTIANQIVVLPDGTWSTVSPCSTASRTPTARAATAWRSSARTDKGETWDSKPTIVNRSRPSEHRSRPNAPCPDHRVAGRVPVRTGDIIPDFAVDRRAAALYAVWQDSRFGRQPDDIALSRRPTAETLDRARRGEPDPTTRPRSPRRCDVRDDGTVAVTYYDFRNDQNGDGDVDTDYWIGPLARRRRDVDPERGPADDPARSTCGRRRSPWGTSWVTTRARQRGQRVHPAVRGRQQRQHWNNRTDVLYRTAG